MINIEYYFRLRSVNIIVSHPTVSFVQRVRMKRGERAIERVIENVMCVCVWYITTHQITSNLNSQFHFNMNDEWLSSVFVPFCIICAYNFHSVSPFFSLTHTPKFSRCFSPISHFEAVLRIFKFLFLYTR